MMRRDKDKESMHAMTTAAKRWKVGEEVRLWLQSRARRRGEIEGETDRIGPSRNRRKLNFVVTNVQDHLRGVSKTGQTDLPRRTQARLRVAK
eukprot:3109322-Pleurochrysis_carterae.AAC.1